MVDGVTISPSTHRRHHEDHGILIQDVSRCQDVSAVVVDGFEAVGLVVVVDISRYSNSSRYRYDGTCVWRIYSDRRSCQGLVHRYLRWITAVASAMNPPSIQARRARRTSIDPYLIGANESIGLMRHSDCLMHHHLERYLDRSLNGWMDVWMYGWTTCWVGPSRRA